MRGENQPAFFWKFPSWSHLSGLCRGSNEILMSYVQDQGVDLNVNLKEPLGLQASSR